MISVIEAARMLADRVGPVIPVRGKIPLWNAWPARASRSIIDAGEWSGATGIGLSTGSKSGYFVVDVDSHSGGLESLAKLEAQHGQLPATWCQLTGGGGLQFFFSVPEFAVKNSRAKLAPGIDTRGEGGFVVSPPSVHPNGSRYCWKFGMSPWNITLAPSPEWLLKSLREEVVAKPAVNNIVHMDLDRTWRRACAYVSRIPGAVAGDGGHDVTFWVAVVLVRGFALSTDKAFTVLREQFNPRCDPPWTEEELSHKVTSAYLKADQPFGYLLVNSSSRNFKLQKAGQ